MNIRLKPGVRAMQFTGTNANEVAEFIGVAGHVEHQYTPSGTLVFKVWWGVHLGISSRYRPSDWIILLPNGEFRGEDAESFAAMYETHEGE